MSAETQLQLFYEEDLVSLIGSAGDVAATVVRTWHEEWDGEDDDEEVHLKKDEYLIEWISGRRKTVNGNSLTLKDRAFQVGDICKGTASHASQQSGVVVDVRTEVCLQSTSSSTRKPDWVSTTSLCRSACIEEGDHVVFNNWVGIVELVFEEALLTVRGSNRPYKVFGVEGGIRYGAVTDELLDTMQGVVSGKLLGAHITPSNSRVVAVRQTAVYVSWLALNQKLSPQEEHLYPEPKVIWTDLEQLTVIHPFEPHTFALGDSVFILDVAGDSAGESRKGSDRFDDDKVLQIYSTKSEVEVLWQDGSRTWQSSTTLQQPPGIEEHHVWPGDHIIYRDEEARDSAAVVQSMEPQEQTASIFVYGDDTEDSRTVSILDCKLQGSPDFLYGLSRGDVVLISGTETGFTPPSVPRLGKLMGEDVDEEEQEERLIFEGRAIAKTASRSQLSKQKRPRLAKEAHDIDWYAVVVDCAPNGCIVVELTDGRRIEERVDRLCKLVDGFDDDHDALSSIGASWRSTDDEEEHGWTGKDGESLDSEDEDWQDDAGSEEEVDMSVDMQSAEPVTFAGFKVLEHAPSDHAFLDQSHAVAQHRSFLARVQREHRILSTSLPATILVRTYEDRMDLFRAIIIGSEGTPYEDAPICIDFHLRATFPQEPPLAHFHSWSRGLGRINPHLYEDGSVCLSLLNSELSTVSLHTASQTDDDRALFSDSAAWQGDTTEAWNPAKSTLLQVLVSIQALVLIAEPGLETEHVQVDQQSSALYSEKAYILSRHFIVHALQTGVKGFEADLKVIYGKTGRLSSAIQKARSLLGRTSDSEKRRQLTKGGAIALSRVVLEMEKIHLCT